MTPNQSVKYIKKRIYTGIKLEEALTTFINFYESKRILFLSKNRDQDMLLFQYGGPYYWSPYVSINLTRQYMFHLLGVDLGIKQLSMNINYKQSDLEFKDGNFWLEQDLDLFRAKVMASDAVQKAKSKDYVNIEFNFGTT